MDQDWQIKDKTVLITGGATGIGAAKVEALLKEGVKQIAILDIAEEPAQTLIKRCKDSNKILFKKCDVANEENLTKVFEEVVSVFKRIDLIINCAGILDDSPANWSKECDINLKAVISMTWKGINHMGTDKGGAGGTIVNVASVAGLKRIPFVPVYCATKSAVIHFSRCLSDGDFFERTGIRILSICYNRTDTGILQNLKRRERDEFMGDIFEKAVTADMVAGPSQKIESAANAFMEMLKKGCNGSVWLSAFNKPARDITSDMDAAFKIFQKVFDEQASESIGKR